MVIPSSFHYYHRNNGGTSLHSAVISGDMASVAHLVRTGGGASITALDSHGNMPLTYCTTSSMFHALLDHSFSHPSLVVAHTMDSSGKTLLHYAALFCQSMMVIVNIILLMLQAAADLEQGPHNHHHLIAVDNGGDTFLQSAAKVGNVHVLEALLWLMKSHSPPGHMVSMLLSQCDMYSKSLREALLNGGRDFVEGLLELASIDARVQLSSVTLDLIVADGILPETIHSLEKEMDGEDVVRHMPLYVLLYARKFDAVQLILHYATRFNFTVSQQDKKHKRTCLHWAVLHQRLDIVEILIKFHMHHDSNMNDHPEILEGLPLKPTIKDLYGKTTLEMANEIGNEDVLEALCRNPSFNGYLKRLNGNCKLHMQINLMVATVISAASFGALSQVPSMLNKLNELRFALWIFLAGSIVAFCTSMFAICKTIVHLRVQSIRKAHRYIFDFPDERFTAVIIVSSISLVIAFVVASIASFMGFTREFHKTNNAM